MKKLIKYILLLLIVSTIILIYPFNSKAEDNFTKGQLRCPPEYLGKGCIEETENGEVKRVIVTEKSGDYEISKIVSKKDEVGHFDVKFTVKGKQSTFTELKDAYIILLFDTSGSIQNSWGNAKEAINLFGKHEQLQGSNFMVVQFATHLSSALSEATGGLSYPKLLDSKTNVLDYFSSSIDVGKLCEYDNCGMSSSSRIELALKYANTVFTHPSMPDNVKKYIVIFGDGYYHNEKDTCWNERKCGYGRNFRDWEVGLEESKTNRIRVVDILDTVQKNAKFYGILYKGPCNGHDTNCDINYD